MEYDNIIIITFHAIMEDTTISVFKNIIKVAQRQKNTWEEDHIQGILILCFESFPLSETKIFQLISDLKMFKGSLLAKLLDKGLVKVEKTWEMICDFSVNESKFRSIIQSAVDSDIPMYIDRLDDINVLDQVSVCNLIL